MSEFIEQFIDEIERQHKSDVDQLKRYYELIAHLNYKIHERSIIIMSLNKIEYKSQDVSK